MWNCVVMSCYSHVVVAGVIRHCVDIARCLCTLSAVQTSTAVECNIDSCDDDDDDEGREE